VTELSLSMESCLEGGRGGKGLSRVGCWGGRKVKRPFWWIGDAARLEMLELFVKGANEFVWAAKSEPSGAMPVWEELVSSTLARLSEHGAGGT